MNEASAAPRLPTDVCPRDAIAIGTIEGGNGRLHVLLVRKRVRLLLERPNGGRSLYLDLDRRLLAAAIPLLKTACMAAEKVGTR